MRHGFITNKSNPGYYFTVVSVISRYHARLEYQGSLSMDNFREVKVLKQSSVRDFKLCFQSLKIFRLVKESHA